MDQTKRDYFKWGAHSGSQRCLNPVLHKTLHNIHYTQSAPGLTLLVLCLFLDKMIQSRTVII